MEPARTAARDGRTLALRFKPGFRLMYAASA